MPTATADIATIEASRLIKRLCTHWAHKFAVEFDAERAFIPFADDVNARLQADDQRLLATVEAPDEDTLVRYQGVVANHLARMQRAGELQIDWQRDAAG